MNNTFYEAFWIGGSAILAFIAVRGTIRLKRVERANDANKLLLQEQIRNINHNIAFAEQISTGNLESQLSEKDDLGKSLLKMRDNLKMVNSREQEEKFISTGLAHLGDVIIKHAHDVNLLANEFTVAIVKYVNVNQGALFLAEGEGKDTHLDLMACYAFNRKKYINKAITIGEGLIGQCYLEGSPIYLTEVPEDYVKITSGLGEALPRSVYLIPLKTKDEVIGVIELASFRLLRHFERTFIEKAAENIASVIVSSRTTTRIKSLLDEAQQQAEELRAQEEEMRQNMEELSASQEAMERQMTETRILANSLQEREDVFTLTTILSESDSFGNITLVNKKLTEVSKYSKEELLGKAHNIFRHPDMPPQLFKLMWQTIKAGEVFRGVVKNRAKDGSPYWVDATIVPVKGDNGQIIKYIGARYHIREELTAKVMYNKQAEHLGLPVLQ